MFHATKSDTWGHCLLSIVLTHFEFICSGTFLWLFSPTWDAVKITVTLKVGFICPFGVIDPTNHDLGATTVVAQA